MLTVSSFTCAGLSSLLLTHMPKKHPEGEDNPSASRIFFAPGSIFDELAKDDLVCRRPSATQRRDSFMLWSTLPSTVKRGESRSVWNLHRSTSQHPNEGGRPLMLHALRSGIDACGVY